MDDYDKTRLKYVKKKLVTILESGTIADPKIQYNIINDTLNEILGLKDKTICSKIIQYFNDQENLEKQIESKQKELQKLVDEYSDNVKDIYEMVKTL